MKVNIELDGVRDTIEKVKPWVSGIAGCLTSVGVSAMLGAFANALIYKDPFTRFTVMFACSMIGGMVGTAAAKEAESVCDELIEATELIVI